MKELTYEEFCDLPYTYTLGLHGGWGAARLYRNDEYGLQWELHTKKNGLGEWQDERRTRFVDGDPREFYTVADQYVAYMEKVCGIKSTD
jgi:hypothetical protein